MIPEDGYGSYTCMAVKRQGRDLELRNSGKLRPIRVGRQLATCAGQYTLVRADLDSGELRLEKSK
jgi:hypothetical protein